MLQTKFQVSTSPGTWFSKIEIWPKSAVNWVCMYIGPASDFFFLYLDLTLGLCRAVFPMSLVSPIGLPAY